MVPKLKEKDVESLKVEQDKGNYIRYFKTAKEKEHQEKIDKELDQIFGEMYKLKHSNT
ncbi:MULTISPECIES: hypothetical protein [unclassified Okeania]|uniref:hypothetical protein n=1 Tax=unclassified Okeania TaxID=2634635 RepID=UPI0013B8B890|nr:MULTISPECIES: hypothetical protein [unclassified Okeania]NES75769.1 hypothetical protein [Okeania sp. SIO1H4]NET13387.1 hypothetical protein [Okeania sp. SIO1H6]NET19951.1 hypothetical protein [Okeania sp. SIO1H5]NET91785.1 hypothetical protein [Okeania sp. SIO1H2]